MNPGSERGQYLADLYCGTGGVGKAAQYFFGVVAKLFDIIYGPEFDLTDKTLISRLCHDVARECIIACMIAIACASWSVARNRTNVIRTRSSPWGLSESQDPSKPLSEKDQQRIAEGNLQLRRLLPFLRTLVKHRVPFIIENPASSNIFWVPQLRALLRYNGVHLIEVDQCFFGRPWRKRTKLLVGFLDEQDVDSLSRCRCHGHKTCEFTGRRHVQLTGSNTRGVSMTALAQEFPKKMSRKLCRCLPHNVMHRRTLASHP